MQETWVRSLGQKDPLEKEVAIHSSILAYKIPWAEEPGSLESMGLQTIGHDLATRKQQQQKCTKAQPLAEDAHTWQCTPDMWTNLCD